MKSIRYAFFTLWSVLAIFGGSIFTLFTIKESWIGFRSYKWPTTNIIEIKTKGTEAKPSYKHIEYEYIVGNEKFKSDKIWFGSSGPQGDSEDVEDWIADNRSRKVAYNPENPNEGVLIPGIKKGIFEAMAGGLGFLIGGILVFKFRNKLA
jgi:hypothetical protein